jgi:outer membrane protein assembly factor BamB
MRHFYQSLVIQIALILFLPPFAHAESGTTQNWNQYRGPNRNGISTESGWLCEWPKEGPPIAWKESIGTGFASMAVVDGKVYAMGYDEKAGEDVVHCFDAATGEEKWTYRYECDIRDRQHEGGPSGTPAVTDKYVFTIGKEADFHCLDANTGQKVWYKDLTQEVGAKIPTWSFSGSPLLLGDRVVIDVGRIVAMDQATGNVVWQTKDYGAAYSSPVAFEYDGKQCLAVLPEIGLVILDAANGEQVAFHSWETKYGVNATTPLIDGNKVFLSTGYNRGCSLVELKGGDGIEALWENGNMNNHFNSSILWNGHIFGMNDNEKTLACLDASSGETVWAQEGFGKGSVALADGKLIVLSEKGEMAIAEASPAGYKELSRAQVLGGKCWTVPVISGGRIYARNAKGDLVCLDVSAG